MTDYLTARGRPLGIILLSILHFVGGIGLVIGTVMLITMRNNPQMLDALSSIGISFPILVGGVGFLAALGIASAVGMWKGRVWGWYLGSFWYVYAIFRSATALLAVSSLATEIALEQATQGARGPGHYYIKFTGRILISALILMYFCKRNVREYFGLTEFRLWKPIATQVAICCGIAIAITAVAQLM